MQKLGKQNQRVRLAMFEGLSEKELNTLYNLATIKRLQAGEVLIKEGDTDQTVYVVLDGQIRIVKDMQGRAKEISTLREGDWIGEIAFTKQIPRMKSGKVLNFSPIQNSHR
jgi:CRP-like cAMP-binding protein